MNIRHTDKLYLDDPYETNFRATVISASPRGIVLDRSCFYPESGGQMCDRGKLGDFDVVDVQEGDGESIVHIVRGDATAQGELDGHVDWERRFDHMQQHTGQHVLSRAFIDTAGLATVSFHMGEDTCTIDLNGQGLDPDRSARAEELANRIIAENRPLTTRVVPIAELDQSELRRKVPDGVENVRLVDIADFDVIPCCGTHVAATGELRLIKVLKHEMVKGNDRVYFKVGARAIVDYSEKHDILHALSSRLSTSGADIAARVNKLLEENRAGRKANRRLARKLAVVEKDLLLAAADLVGSTRLVVCLIPDADADYLRTLSNEIRSEADVIALLAAGDGSVVCVASSGVSVDLAGPAVDLAKAMGGSGGGKGAFARLTLPRGVDLSKFLDEMEEDVRRRM